MTSWEGGKGSKPRPVDKSKFDANFDRIFGTKDKPTASEKDKPIKK